MNDRKDHVSHINKQCEPSEDIPKLISFKLWPFDPV